MAAQRRHAMAEFDRQGDGLSHHADPTSADLGLVPGRMILSPGPAVVAVSPQAPTGPSSATRVSSRRLKQGDSLARVSFG